MGWVAAAGMLLLGAAPAGAEQRVLEVPATASWQHAATGFIAPPKVAGFTRTKIADSTNEELDVAIAYASPDNSAHADVYLFKPGLYDLPVWFDRAMTAIRSRPEYGIAGEPAATAVAFSRPGAAAKSGLRAVMPIHYGDYKSSAVALLPMDGWLVTVRMSSTAADPAEVDARLTAFVAGLRWPAEKKPAAEAVPVVDCLKPLAFKKAKRLPQDMTSALIAATGAMIRDKPEAPPPVYCRDPSSTDQYGVYRPNGSKDGYVVARGDAGIALGVFPEIDISGFLGTEGSGGKSRVSVTLLNRGTVGEIASFNRLPPPEQAVNAPPSKGTHITVSSSKEN